MRLSLWKFLLTALACLPYSGAFAAPASSAQAKPTPTVEISPAWPKGPVNYIIPFGAGGESTIAADLQAAPFRALTGEDLVILNKPGAGGALIWASLNQMAADGSVIAGINIPHIFLQPAAGANYRTEDLDVVHIFHYTPDAIIVRANSPYATLNDLLADARKRPGEVTFSGSGFKTANHLAQARFDHMADIKTGYRSYKGSQESVVALLARETDAAWGYTTVAGAHGRNVRMLAVATEERHPRFPNVPTFRELGFDLVQGAYRGIAVPRGTSQEIRERISEVFSQINHEPGYVKASTDLGFVLVDIGVDAVPEFLKTHRDETLQTGKTAGLID